MKNVGIVQGNATMAVPVYVGKTMVYVHEDIVEIEPPEESDEKLYQYHEVQYSKDEYIQFMVDTQFKQSADIDYIAMMADIELPDEEV